MSDTILWCIHIPGPDDIRAVASKEIGEADAEAHNKWIEKLFADDPSDPMRETSKAVVIVWPYTPESHAESLLDERWKA